MHSITFLEKYCPFSSVSIRKDHEFETSVSSLPGEGQAESVFQVPDFPAISTRCFQSINDIPQSWDTLASDASALLQRSFLQAIENASPDGMEFYYLSFYQNERPVGIAYFQRLRFEPDRAIKLEAAVPSRLDRLKKWLAGQFRHTLLIAGNALLTGQHGYYFSEEIPVLHQVQIMEKSSWQLATRLRGQGLKVDAIVHKDISSAHLPTYDSWRQSKYHALCFQPNMEIELRPEWHSFDDYLNAMSSKYRVRARRAAKKSKDLQRRWLTQEEIAEHSTTLFDLYEQIADQSNFNLVHLHSDFFLQMKKHLGDQYEVLAYFRAGQPVGFCTLLHHNGRAEAHFLGLTEEVNRSTQLYLNMLYDLIRKGIEKGSTRIGFARTAMEIKSSIGAVPDDLYVLTRSYSPLINSIVSPVVRFLIQDVAWKQRRPFK